MKKNLIIITVVVIIAALSTGALFAQTTDKKVEKKQEEKAKKFANTWKKIGNKTKEIRSFKTEKATTVAGVRGAEAEDEALKHLYYKGGVKYPSRMELKNAIDMLDAFVKASPGDPSVPETQYFIGQCHLQLGDNAKAKTVFEALVKDFPANEYATLAQADLKTIKK